MSPTLSRAWPTLTTGNSILLTITPKSIMILATKRHTTSFPTKTGIIAQGFPKIVIPEPTSLALR